MSKLKHRRETNPLRWTLARRKVVWAYIFLAIPIVFFAYIRIYPTLFAFQMSLHDYNPLAVEQPYVGFENYERVFEQLNRTKSVTKSAFRNTASYLLLGVPIQLFLALAIALMLNEIRFMSSLYRILFFLPFVTSTIAIAWVFRMLYQPRFGMVNIILQLVSLPQQPFLKSPQQALPSVLALVIWQGMGFAVIIFLAGLKQISRTYYEAAEVDGASRWDTFRYITMPLLNPSPRLSAGIADDIFPADVCAGAGDDRTRTRRSARFDDDCRVACLPRSLPELQYGICFVVNRGPVRVNPGYHDYPTGCHAAANGLRRARWNPLLRQIFSKTKVR